MKKEKKALLFVEHIERHIRTMIDEKKLPKGSKVCCKICGKTIDQIAKEPVLHERRDVR
jgi:hypothetical protein